MWTALIRRPHRCTGLATAVVACRKHRRILLPALDICRPLSTQCAISRSEFEHSARAASTSIPLRCSACGCHRRVPESSHLTCKRLCCCSRVSFCAGLYHRASAPRSFASRHMLLCTNVPLGWMWRPVNCFPAEILEEPDLVLAAIGDMQFKAAVVQSEMGRAHVGSSCQY